MLDDADHAGRHEPGGSHGLAGAGDLGHLRDAPGGGHLHPPARLRGQDVELAHAAADVHEDLDPITLHVHERRTRRSARAWMARGGPSDRAATRLRVPDTLTVAGSLARLSGDWRRS